MLEHHSDPKGEGTLFAFTKDLRINNSSWITLQVSASNGIHPIDAAFPQATTNPIWIMVGKRPVRSKISANYFINWIDKLSQMAFSHPGWRSQREREHVLEQFREAREIYKQLSMENVSPEGP